MFVAAIFEAPRGEDWAQALTRDARSLSSTLYSAGTTSRVSAVDATRPAIMAHASGGHSEVFEVANGHSPATVVTVVSRIGRVRSSTAFPMASASGAPSARRRSIT